MEEAANSDELSAFVSSTLKAIAAGITEAGAAKISRANQGGVSGFGAPRFIEFDIAVSAKSTGSAGGGLKVAVFGIGANAEGQRGSESSTVSRIKFSVPTTFTQTRDSGDDPADWITV